MDKQLNIFEVYLGIVSRVDLDSRDGLITINQDFAFKENFPVSLNESYLCYFKDNKVKLLPNNYDVFYFKVLLKEFFLKKDNSSVKELLLSLKYKVKDNLDKKFAQDFLSALIYIDDNRDLFYKEDLSLFKAFENKGLSQSDLEIILDPIFTYTSSDAKILQDKNRLIGSFNSTIDLQIKNDKKEEQSNVDKVKLYDYKSFDNFASDDTKPTYSNENYEQTLDRLIKKYKDVSCNSSAYDEIKCFDDILIDLSHQDTIKIEENNKDYNLNIIKDAQDNFICSEDFLFLLKNYIDLLVDSDNLDTNLILELSDTLFEGRDVIYLNLLSTNLYQSLYKIFLLSKKDSKVEADSLACLTLLLLNIVKSIRSDSSFDHSLIAKIKSEHLDLLALNLSSLIKEREDGLYLVDLIIELLDKELLENNLLDLFLLGLIVNRGSKFLDNLDEKLSAQALNSFKYFYKLNPNKALLFIEKESLHNIKNLKQVCSYITQDAHNKEFLINDILANLSVSTQNLIKTTLDFLDNKDQNIDTLILNNLNKALFIYHDKKENYLYLKENMTQDRRISCDSLNKDTLEILHTKIKNSLYIVHFNIDESLYTKLNLDSKDNLDLNYLYALNHINTNDLFSIYNYKDYDLKDLNYIKRVYTIYILELYKLIKSNRDFIKYLNKALHVYIYLDDTDYLLSFIDKDLSKKESSLCTRDYKSLHKYKIICATPDILYDIAKEYVSEFLVENDNTLYLDSNLLDKDSIESLILSSFYKQDKTALYVNLNSYLKDKFNLKKFFTQEQSKQDPLFLISLDDFLDLSLDLFDSNLLFLNTQKYYKKDFVIKNDNEYFKQFVKESNYEYLSNQEIDLDDAKLICHDESFCSLVDTYKDFCKIYIFKGELETLIKLHIDYQQYFKDKNIAFNYESFNSQEEIKNKIHLVKIFNRDLVDINIFHIADKSNRYYYLYQIKKLRDLVLATKKAAIYVVSLQDHLLNILSTYCKDCLQKDFIDIYINKDDFISNALAKPKSVLLITEDNLDHMLKQCADLDLIYVIDSLLNDLNDETYLKYASSDDIAVIDKKIIVDEGVDEVSNEINSDTLLVYALKIKDLYNHIISLNDKASVYLIDPFIDREGFKAPLPFVIYNTLSLFKNDKEFETYYYEKRALLDILYNQYVDDNPYIDYSKEDKLKFIEEKFLPKDASLRKEQLEILDHVLDDKNKQSLFISLKTGGGKSILFQGPALLKSLIEKKLSIVIVPIKALMIDQVVSLHQKGFTSSVEYISSDRSSNEVNKIYQDIVSSKINLLYVSPERFKSESFVKVLEQRLRSDNGLAYFIFDEAHCISQWGHSFRIEYLSILNTVRYIKQSYANTKLLFLSATATKNLVKQISDNLNLDILTIGMDLEKEDPTAKHLARNVSTIEKYKDYEYIENSIIKFYRLNQDKITTSNVLVFCRSRKQTEDYAKDLNNAFAQTKDLNSLNCDYFHAQMHKEQKEDLIARFKQGDINVLFATIAFGVGMDIPNIHKIIQANYPTNIEEYLQELGRAGRDLNLAQKLKLDHENAINTTCIRTKGVNLNNKEIEKTLYKMNDLSIFSIVQDYIREYVEQLEHDTSFYENNLLAIPKSIIEGMELKKEYEFHSILYYLELMNRLRVKYRYSKYLPIKIKSLKSSNKTNNMLLRKIKQNIIANYQNLLSDDVDFSILNQGYLFINLGVLQQELVISYAVLLNLLHKLEQDDCISIKFFIYVKAQKINDLIYTVDLDNNIIFNNNALQDISKELKKIKNDFYEYIDLFLLPNNKDKLFYNIKRVSYNSFAKNVQEKFKKYQNNDDISFFSFDILMPNNIVKEEFIDINKIRSLLLFLQKHKFLKYSYKYRNYYIKQEKKYSKEYLYSEQDQEALKALADDEKIKVRLYHIDLALDNKNKDNIKIFIDKCLILMQEFLTLYAKKVENKESNINLILLSEILNINAFNYDFTNFTLIKDLLVSLKFFEEIEDSPVSTLINLTHNFDLKVLSSIKSYQDLPQYELDLYEDLSSNDVKTMELYTEVQEIALARNNLFDIYLKTIEKDRYSQNNFLNEYFSCKSVSDYNKLLFKSLKKEDNQDVDICTVLNKDFDTNILKKRVSLLNKDQKEIYNLPLNCDISVMAGPGTGKTTVLIMRCVKLICDYGIEPSEILIIAYNRAVIIELKRRLNEIFVSLNLGKMANFMKIYNYHQLAYKLYPDELNSLDFDAYESLLLHKLNTQKNLVKQNLGLVKCILVDEFQDITQNRLDILFNLKNLDKECRLFAIGDVNQSIYGFQKQKDFEALQERVHTASLFNDSKYSILDPLYYYEILYKKLPDLKKMSISTNYRSYKAILDEACVFIQNNINKVYASAENTIAPYAQNCVKITYIDTFEQKNSLFNSLNRSLHEICTLVRQGNNISSLALLFRINADIDRAAPYVQDLVLDLGINARVTVYKRDEELYFNSPEFNLFYKSLEDLQDKSFTYEELDKYIRAYFKTWSELKCDLNNLDYAYTLALYCLDEMDSYEISLDNYMDFYKDYASSESDAIFNIYNMYAKEHLVKTDLEISLSTIHRVKGLEFDAVVIPACFSSLPFTKDRAYIQDYLDEERRLYYVAYTRAKKILHIYRSDREIALLNNKTYSFRGFYN